VADATYITWSQVLQVQQVPREQQEPGLVRVQEPVRAQPWEPVSALQPFCTLQLQKIMPRRKTVKK
jgi:hypothetical protein